MERRVRGEEGRERERKEDVLPVCISIKSRRIKLSVANKNASRLFVVVEIILKIFINVCQRRLGRKGK
jgi:hypothetical protein